MTRQPEAPGARGILGSFARPSGASGRVVGWLLARFNSRLNRDAVLRLSPGPSASVLEIGFGPGVGIRRLSERVTTGLVAGIDPSDVMHRQATRRNREAIRSGRVVLRYGTADELPWERGTFDAVLSLNNILLWQPLGQGLREVHRVLRPGGTLLVGIHEWAARGESLPGAGSLAQVEESLAGSLRVSGFGGIATELVRAPMGHALLISAQRVESAAAKGSDAPGPDSGPPWAAGSAELRT